MLEIGDQLQPDRLATLSTHDLQIIAAICVACDLSLSELRYHLEELPAEQLDQLAQVIYQSTGEET
jgi:hypothetical protein